MTKLLCSKRKIEMDVEKIEFDADYHNNVNVSSAQSRDLTIKLLKRFLEEPKTLTIPSPDLTTRLACDF